MRSALAELWNVYTENTVQKHPFLRMFWAVRSIWQPNLFRPVKQKTLSTCDCWTHTQKHLTEIKGRGQQGRGAHCELFAEIVWAANVFCLYSEDTTVRIILQHESVWGPLKCNGKLMLFAAFLTELEIGKLYSVQDSQGKDRLTKNQPSLKVLRSQDQWISGMNNFSSGVEQLGILVQKKISDEINQFTFLVLQQYNADQYAFWEYVQAIECQQCYTNRSVIFGKVYFFAGNRKLIIVVQCWRCLGKTCSPKHILHTCSKNRVYLIFPWVI